MVSKVLAQPEQDRFLDLVMRNPVNEAILQRLPALKIPDGYLVAGCLFQTVWNCLAGKAPTKDILDYDVFYFDSADTSWEAEDAVIQRCKKLFADLDIDVQVRNQARVHMWYSNKFGVECPPLQSSRDGIDHFLNQSSCYGIRHNEVDTEVYAPFGFKDLFLMVVRPNLRRWLPYIYRKKAVRWSQVWPNLTVIPWPESSE